MVNHPKVSIIIPVYNGANYLSEAIDSALAQTYLNIEIIVVNDGSNDQGQTEKIALEYGGKISYFSKPNGGVASALNLAISKMTGEYFSWLSHDSLYYPNKVETQINKLNELKIFDCVLYSDFTIFNVDLNRIYPYRVKKFDSENFRYQLTIAPFIHGCALLIPRKAFVKCGLFNEQLRTKQDYDMWFRIAREYQFFHVSELLIKSRAHSEQGNVTMSGIAFGECSDLLISFINDLSLEEITKATGKDKANSYLEIAESMWARGYSKAGERAYALARKYGAPRRSLKLIIKNIKFKIKNWLFKTARTIIPSRIRVILKQLLHKSPLNNNLTIANSSVEETDNRPINENLVFGNNLQEKFTKVYKENIFGGSISKSGEGSNLEQTQLIRQELPAIIKKFNIKTFLDAPCGDYYWMQKVNLGASKYIGIDIVDDLVKLNNSKYGNDGVVFYNMNLAKDPLPKADLIFSRDCHVHLNFKDTLDMLLNFKNSGAKYLLMTTFEDRNLNKDLTRKDDFWRPLNMNLPPFNFPKPLLLVNEGCSEEADKFSDKCLGLWLLDDIKITNII